MGKDTITIISIGQRQHAFCLFTVHPVEIVFGAYVMGVLCVVCVCILKAKMYFVFLKYYVHLHLQCILHGESYSIFSTFSQIFHIFFCFDDFIGRQCLSFMYGNGGKSMSGSWRIRKQALFPWKHCRQSKYCVSILVMMQMYFLMYRKYYVSVFWVVGIGLLNSLPEISVV